MNQFDLEQASLCSKSLYKAARSIRVLSNLSWGAEIKRDFFASGCERLPQVDYPKFDVITPMHALTEARAFMPRDECEIASSPVWAWLARISTRLETACQMLAARQTVDFFNHSQKLYAAPTHKLLDGKTSALDLAAHMDEVLGGVDFDQLVTGGEPEPFGASIFVAKLSEQLAPYFKDQAPKVMIANDLSAKAIAGATRIRIQAEASFSDLDVHQLLHHEALIHSATALNGHAQDKFPILGSAHAGTTETQEGLAVFAEIISGVMDPSRFRRLVDRVVAIDMAIKGADFIEVFRYFKSRNPDPSQPAFQAFDDTRRIFRGGVMSGGAPFTKDGVYLNGLLRVHNFLRTVTKLGRADLIRLLFVGKLDIEDIPALAVLAEHGMIRAPEIVPPWIADMRFLVSYLAYSSFLNQVKLPGFQNYYQDMVGELPQMWHFGGAKNSTTKVGK